MTWIDKLLDNVRTLFTGLYGEQLKSKNAESSKYPFDDYFDRQVQELESKSEGQVTKSGKQAAVRDSSEDEEVAKPAAQSLKSRQHVPCLCS